MKSVNLICDSEILQEKHFFTTDYHGHENIVLRTTENEFVHRSLNITAYSRDFKPLPYMRSAVDGVAHSTVKDFICGGLDEDFFIIADKGTIGFDNMIFMSKCHIEAPDNSNELILKVMLETGEATKNSLLEAYHKNDSSTAFFFNDNFFSRINDCPASVPELVKKAEETPFLDIDDKDYAIHLSLNAAGTFQIALNSRGYTLLNDKEPIQVGSILYTYTGVINGLEIAEIRQIAHSVYGQFYAVLETAYVYPRDAELIRQKFPSLYKEQCLTKAERTVREFIGKPEKLSFVPINNELGEPVIHQQIDTACGYAGISNNVFQFMIGGSKGFGDYENSDSAFIRIERNALVGTIIQVDGRYKILLYKLENVVQHNGTNYARFKFDDESEFFNDFSSSAKVAFKKMAHFNICRLAEFLLCRGKIAPVVISQEKYNSFSSNR